MPQEAWRSLSFIIFFFFRKLGRNIFFFFSNREKKINKNLRVVEK